MENEILISGFKEGFWHPIMGLDHLLSMLSVGILSAQMGKKAVWYVPLTFVVLMGIGGTIGLKEIELPFVEKMISLSVIALGVSIAVPKKLPVVLVMAFVGIFAIFHGHAHGVEIPYATSPKDYALGFLSGTTLIHIVGVFIGLINEIGPKAKKFLQALGAFVALAGIYILFK